MTTVPSQGEQQSSGEDIVQFWNTSERIWTTFTTSWEAHLCKADLKVYINHGNITFYRAYIEDGGTRIGYYNGTFRHYYKQSGAPYDAVRIQVKE
ncbi:hypothetical protein MTO96_040997 [Rhipicephalus appendiculatus]